MASVKINRHITSVGVIHIVWGIFGLIGAVAFSFIILSYIREIAENNDIPYVLLKYLSVSIILLWGFLSFTGIAGGIGLLYYKQWARYIIIVISAIECFIVPVGTLLGVYSLWVLLQDETAGLFKKI